MSQIRLILLLSGAIAFATGCPDPAPPDGGGRDAGDGVGRGDDDGGVPPQRPAAFGVTSGGGAAASSNYRVNVTIGAPQATGRAASGSYQLRLVGPDRQ